MLLVDLGESSARQDRVYAAPLPGFPRRQQRPSTMQALTRVGGTALRPNKVRAV